MVGRNILERNSSHDIFSPNREELDLRNKVDVRRYLKALSPDLIIHAAGRVGGIKANMASPYEFLLENLEIGSNVIGSAVDVGVPRVINLASSCIYPRNVDGLLSEDMVLSGQLEPTNEGYALSKISALRLCEFANRRPDPFEYKTLIPCNLYGPYDKFDLESAHLIPAIISKIHCAKAENKSTVEIWGDGSARREFMYVADLVTAIFKAVDDYDSLPSVINIGLGFDYTVHEYYRAVADVVQWNGGFTFDLSKPVGMKRKLLNVDRQASWGFNPEHSLSEGIEKTYEYYMRTIKK